MLENSQVQYPNLIEQFHTIPFSVWVSVTAVATACVAQLLYFTASWWVNHPEMRFRSWGNAQQTWGSGFFKHVKEIWCSTTSTNWMVKNHGTNPHHDTHNDTHNDSMMLFFEGGYLLGNETWYPRPSKRDLRSAREARSPTAEFELFQFEQREDIVGSRVSSFFWQNYPVPRIVILNCYTSLMQFVENLWMSRSTKGRKLVEKSLSPRDPEIPFFAEQTVTNTNLVPINLVEKSLKKFG